KEIEVSSNQIDEKAVYRIEVRLNNETVGTDEITIYNVSDGKDGTDGTDGTSTYTHIMYSDEENSVSMNPSDWEQGSISNNGNNIINPASNRIRTIDYHEIEPDTDYYVRAYGNYEARIMFYDEDEEYLNERYWGEKGSFITPVNAKYFR